MENFALLKLLSALGNLAPKQNTEQTAADKPKTDETASVQPNKPPENTEVYPNVMASVLERHEYISNRVKNKK